MSEVYVLEPPTAGKVVVHTTHGQLDIELWSKECPKACRNFVQLCLDGYYDGCTFHRIIPQFIVQTGDPTGTGTGGESIYSDEVFPVETHPRLQYRYRGLVGLATLNPDGLDPRDPEAATSRRHGSQFFITLSGASALNRNNTLFGKVTGNSLYNLLSIAEVPVDSTTDRPLDPPRITETEVLLNPFPNLAPRPGCRFLLRQEAEEREQQRKAELASRGSKTLSGTFRTTLSLRKKGLLSFEEDEEEDTDVPKQPECMEEPLITPVSDQQVSSKEHLTAEKRAKSGDGIDTLKDDKLRRLKERVTLRMELPVGAETSDGLTTVRSSRLDRDVATAEAEMNESLSESSKELEHVSKQDASVSNSEEDTSDAESEDSDDTELRVVKASRISRNKELSRLQQRILVFKAGQGTADQESRERESVQDADLLTEAEKRRQFYLSRRGQTSKRQRQDEVLQKFKEFQQKLHQPATGRTETRELGAKNLEPEQDEDDPLWYAGSGLKFAVDSARAYEMDASKDALVTFDPLASKSKAEVAEKMRALKRELALTPCNSNQMALRCCIFSF